MTHTPTFWIDKNNWQAQALRPFSWLYAAGLALRYALTKGSRVSVPVICVGNVVVGGAGKTPVVKALAAKLKAMGKNPHIVSRGYGGKLAGPVRVNLTTHGVADVGDEPLTLAHVAPTWVAKNKVAGAVQAILNGADCILLDDGLQNPTLHKNLSFLVLDDRAHNGLLLPAGPLREPLSWALKRVQAVIATGAAVPVPDQVMLSAHATTFGITQNIKGKKLFAFCGIANPQKFYNGLTQAGADVVGTRSFPDHHVFSEAELNSVLQEAQKLGAEPACTAKDGVRITPPLPAQLIICDVDLAFADDALVEGFLRMVF